jgi:hypothetical protein
MSDKSTKFTERSLSRFVGRSPTPNFPCTLGKIACTPLGFYPFPGCELEQKSKEAFPDRRWQFVCLGEKPLRFFFEDTCDFLNAAVKSRYSGLLRFETDFRLDPREGITLDRKLWRAIYVRKHFEQITCSANAMLQSSGLSAQSLVYWE